MFTTPISGSIRNVVASTGKDGMLRLLDRDSTDIFYILQRSVHDPVVLVKPFTSAPLESDQELNGSITGIRICIVVGREI